MWSEAQLSVSPRRRAAPADRGSWRTGALWLAAGCAVAVAAGAASVRPSYVAAIPFVLAGLVVAALVPVHWLGAAAIVAGLTYRLAVPTASGPAAYVPDALVATVCLRVAAAAALGRTRPLPAGMRVALIGLVVFATVATASMVANHDSVVVLIGSLRQFARYPALAVALVAAGLTWRQVRTMLTAVLAVSLIELPLTLYQYRHPVSSGVLSGVHFFHGDNVSGTFGYGGNSEDMLFLVLCAGVWLALALQRLIRGRWLLLLAPAMVVPMALGSSASFVLLLPLTILGVLVWVGLRSSRRLSMGAVAAGLAFAGVLAWSAGALALAPGIGQTAQRSANTLLSADYLSAYLASTGHTADPSTRIGFLRLAVESNVRSGARGFLLGQGPAVSFIGSRNASTSNRYLTNYPELSIRSVQSLQRTLFGFGFGAVAIYLIVLVAPAAALLRSRPRDPLRRAIVLALPVLAVVMVLAGIYNAAWTDPGVTAAYWALVVVATIAAGPEPEEPEVE